MAASCAAVAYHERAMPPSPIETARKLAVQIRSCAGIIEADRELPASLFEALADAGLFHLILPQSIGCPELDLPTYVKVIGELGLGDASTAWIVKRGPRRRIDAAARDRPVAPRRAGAHNTAHATFQEDTSCALDSSGSGTWGGRWPSTSSRPATP
jgi:indole-3-acetate monooxygenase